MTAIAWPDPPMPGPPPSADGTPRLADGRVFVQIAQAAAPYVWGTATWSAPTAWGVLTPSAILDATCDVAGLSIVRGRNDALEHYAPGALAMSLDDPEYRWGPTSLDPNGVRVMRVGVPVRVVALDLDDETVVPLFAGTVSEVDETDDGSYPPRVTLKALGSFGALAADRVTTPEGGAGELAGARMTRVLEATNYRADWWGWELATGTEPLLPYPVETTDSGEGPSALELLELAADSDGGSLLEAADGAIEYHAAGDLEARVVEYRFTDHPKPQGPGNPYVDVCPVAITFDSDAAAITNAVAVQAEGAAEWHRAEDGVSISWAGRRPVEAGGLLFTTASHGQHLADYLLSRAVRDEFRVTPLQGEALTLPGWWPVALHLRLGDPVKVNRDHGNARVEVNALVQYKRHDITRHAWAVEVGLGAANMRTSYARWNRSSARWGVASWA